MSRKNEVSVVTIASTTSVSQAAVVAPAEPCRSTARCSPKPCRWASGESRDLTRYSLPGSSTRAHCSRSNLATKAKSAAETVVSATAASHSAHDLSGHHRERQHSVGQSGAHDETRHAPHDAGGFVLRENLSSGGANRLAAAQARPAPCPSAPPRGNCRRRRSRPTGTAGQPRGGRRSRAAPG